MLIQAPCAAERHRLGSFLSAVAIAILKLSRNDGCRHDEKLNGNNAFRGKGAVCNDLLAATD
jgi:hypothetical protein